MTTATESALAGVLIRKLYADGGFLIGRLDSGNTVVGDMLEPIEGQEYEFWGEWGEHPKFGKQFKFTRYSACLPKSTDGIVRYLVRVAKWVGQERARAVVEAYGENTLEILKTDPERVAADIKGITINRAREAQRFLLNNEKLEAATVEIEGIIGKVRGLPKNLAAQLLKKYGSDAADELRNNPYIISQFHRVGFRLADSVALLNGYPKDGTHRKCEAVVYVLQEAADRQGHTSLLYNETMARAEKLTGVTINGDIAINELCNVEPIRTELRRFDGHEYMALHEIAEQERNIAGIVRMMMDSPLAKPIPVSEEGLADDQIHAVKLLSDSRIGVLTGPPGSGKTYTFARYVVGLQKAGFKNIIYCAPTGKAAARMTESLADVIPGAQAQTIHRALGPSKNPETGEFEFRAGPACPLECDAVIVDEASMLDTRLAASLLGATTTDMVVLFIGDHYQLPSIGPGAVLKDFAEAGVPTAHLDTIKRNAGQIVRACHQIKDGKAFQWSDSVDLDAGENFRHISKGTGREIIDAIVKLATVKMPAMGLDPMWDFQALAPMNIKSEVSCKALNDALSMALNPGRPIKGLDFIEGDKVVRLKNEVVPGRYSNKFVAAHRDDTDDDLGSVEVVNGDLGKVVAICKNREGKNKVVVHLRNPDRIVHLPRNDHNIQRAYCMTCHKLQGSDAPVVAIPLHKSFGTFPTREWIYTAISRAKTLCLTVGDAEVGLKMVRRLSARRFTKLVERIQGK